MENEWKYMIHIHQGKEMDAHELDNQPDARDVKHYYSKIEDALAGFANMVGPCFTVSRRRGFEGNSLSFYHQEQPLFYVSKSGGDIPNISEGLYMQFADRKSLNYLTETIGLNFDNWSVQYNNSIYFKVATINDYQEYNLTDQARNSFRKYDSNQLGFRIDLRRLEKPHTGISSRMGNIMIEHYYFSDVIPALYQLLGIPKYYFDGVQEFLGKNITNARLTDKIGTLLANYRFKSAYGHSYGALYFSLNNELLEKYADQKNFKITGDFTDDLSEKCKVIHVATYNPRKWIFEQQGGFTAFMDLNRISDSSLLDEKLYTIRMEWRSHISNRLIAVHGYREKSFELALQALIKADLPFIMGPEMLEKNIPGRVKAGGIYHSLTGAAILTIGYQNKKEESMEPGAFIQLNPETLSIGVLKTVMHTLGVESKDANMRFSLPRPDTINQSAGKSRSVKQLKPPRRKL